MFMKSRAEKNVEPSSKKIADNKRERRLGVAQMHSAAGNQAFGRLLGTTAKPVQAKLVVGPSGDPLEREADRVADHVIRSPQSISPINKAAPALRQSPSDPAGSFGPGADFEARLANRGGNPLPDSTRAFMEPRLGADFSAVRIHSGSDAAQLNRAIGARAFTRGSDIYLGEGRHNFHSNDGKQLLAHELTHVVQQSGFNGRNIAPAHTGLVQRFESDEHQHMGDTATGGAAYDLGSKTDKFELTHGDIIALSGDVFPPDELFRLAAIPGNRGQNVNTRDEILWALQDTRIWELREAASGPFAGKKDPRFEKGGLYANYVYSDAVKATVFNRYRKLGADNAGHFAAPQGRNAAGVPVPASSMAGGNYRSLHEFAIKEADKAGRAGTTIGMAMAREAAAQHFLTDEFSAGHLRTPIGAIRDYWGGKYPLFWYNLRHKIALDTAMDMWVPTGAAFAKVMAQVEAIAPTLPAVTLGDLLGSVFHDVDNERGIGTVAGGKVFGDKHLDAGTEKLAVSAIKAGNMDITKAYDLGKQSTTPVPDADLFGQVRLTNGGTADKYAPELQIPEPTKGEPPQNWKAPDILALWDQKLLGTGGDTVGQEISRRVSSGAIAVQLNSLASNFPVDGEKATHPRASYLRGFVARLQANPKAGVLDIINWAPHDLGTGGAAAAARESIAVLEQKRVGGEKKEILPNMTPEQRVNYVTVLMANKSDFDQDSIITIFASVAVPNRAELYKGIEGHAWTGDFKRNKGDRDKLYELMMNNTSRVDKLKNVINGV